MVRSSGRRSRIARSTVSPPTPESNTPIGRPSPIALLVPSPRTPGTETPAASGHPLSDPCLPAPRRDERTPSPSTGEGWVGVAALALPVGTPPPNLPPQGGEETQVRRVGPA